MPRTSAPQISVSTWGVWQRVKKLGKNQPHIVLVTDGARAGVLKRPRNNHPTALARFHEEARQMAALTAAGEHGVLPVLDIDKAAAPEWFVMPQARLLADALRERSGQEPPCLRDVVASIADIAETLGRLSDQEIAHRDIKPANLFWLDQRPVVGDFGIAAWPRRPALTLTGENIGPMYFIAPEMRERQKPARDFPADVWSLAKTLFVLAHGLKYPPEGTHYVQGPEFDLWHLGGNAGLRLAPILEAATAYRPRDRISMTDFCTELRLWLDQHPEGTVNAQTFRKGFEVMEPVFAQYERYGAALRRLLPEAARQFAQQLHGSPDLWDAPEGDRGRPEGVKLLGEEQYDFPINSNEGMEPDDFWLLSTRVDSAGRRAVIAGVLLGTDALLIAEIQRVDQNAVVLENGWRRDGHVLMPSAQAARDELMALVSAKLSQTPRLTD
ncbi:protein kinase domain-containing protein [Streptomyces lavendulae]|uniref:protein kinase domain-containing protein n=1 Tax=Streptomyces lavendulae TaxID=1914 RepID=UPI00340B509C